MRKNQSYSVFNNFNKNYHNNTYEPNYFDEYENEFAEELFNQQAYGLSNSYQNIGGVKNSWYKQRKFDAQPRNGESLD